MSESESVHESVSVSGVSVSVYATAADQLTRTIYIHTYMHAYKLQQSCNRDATELHSSSPAASAFIFSFRKVSELSRIRSIGRRGKEARDSAFH